MPNPHPPSRSEPRITYLSTAEKLNNEPRSVRAPLHMLRKNSLRGAEKRQGTSSHAAEKLIAGSREASGHLFTCCGKTHCGEPRSVRAPLHMLRKNSLRGAEKRQGTASVVPIDHPYKSWALAPAFFRFFKYAVPKGYSSGVFANPAFTGLFSMYSRCC